MRAGGGCVVADALAERHRALTGRGCSKPGRRIGLIGLGRRPCSRAAGARRITRSRRSRRRHHDSRLRLGVRVRDRLRWAEAIGYPRALRTRPVTTGPILDAPSFRASALARQATFVDRTPLMRFSFPLQHMPAAMRCPGLCRTDALGETLAGLRTIPLRRFYSFDPRAVAGPIGERSPVRFFAFRRSKAASLEYAGRLGVVHAFPHHASRRRGG